MVHQPLYINIFQCCSTVAIVSHKTAFDAGHVENQVTMDKTAERLYILQFPPIDIHNTWKSQFSCLHHRCSTKRRLSYASSVFLPKPRCISPSTQPANSYNILTNALFLKIIYCFKPKRDSRVLYWLY